MQRQKIRPILIGCAATIEATSRRRGLDLEIRRHSILDREALSAGGIDVYDPGTFDATVVKPGEVSRDAGKASMLYNRQGAELAMADKIDGLVTSPVTKASAKMAGYDYPGQAEYFAELAGDVAFSTILIWRNFKAALFTTHTPLIEACRAVTKDNLLKKIRYLHEKRCELGAPDLRLAVASLNPHAGEFGTMGARRDR